MSVTVPSNLRKRARYAPDDLVLLVDQPPHYSNTRGSGADINWTSSTTNNFHSLTIPEPGTYILYARTQFRKPVMAAGSQYYMCIRNSTTNTSTPDAVDGALVPTVGVYVSDGTGDRTNYDTFALVTVPSGGDTYYMCGLTDSVAATSVMIDTNYTVRFAGSDMEPTMAAIRVQEP